MRPRVEFEWKQFEQLCKMQCTKDEIAGYFNCSIKTVDRRVIELTGESFDVLYKELSAGGKTSLRRAQWRSAIGDKKQSPSVQMQIWLGKQMLSQSDNPTHVEEDEEIPVNFYLGDKPKDE